jgi:hypothetical protein
MRRKGRKWKMKKAGLMMKKTRTIRNLPRNSSTRIRIRSYINLVKNSQHKRIRNNKKLKKQRRHLRFRKLKNPRKLKNSGRNKVNKLKNRQKFSRNNSKKILTKRRMSFGIKKEKNKK